MRDPRVNELAKVLVNYSANVQKDEIVMIHSIGVEALPLAAECYREALKAGAAFVETKFEYDNFKRILFDVGTTSQITWFPQHEMDFMKKASAYIAIRAPENSMAFASVDPDLQAALSRTYRPILEQRVNHTKWVVTRFPTNAMAQEAKMSLDEFTDFFFKATCYDYQGLKKRQAKLRELMEKTSTVKIKATDTDLSFSLKGMPAISCHGDRNIPDGEVFSAPVRDSVEGYITYNTPSMYYGREFNNIRLEFSKGKIVKADAGADSEALNKVFDTDEGARYVGEFSIGTNIHITKPMRNILFDEKIFGSIHFTPGSAYEEECDNGNRSAIHWDLVKILTGNGEIWFDGVLVQKDGLFVHKSLSDLNPSKDS